MAEESNSVNRVYKYGCRRPREEDLALQLLGQAWLYREDLRRVYNTNKRDVRDLIKSKDDVSHVIEFEREVLLERICELRSKRGHLMDFGTYWLVEKAILQASKASGLDPIRRQDWDGTGRIGAAIQSTEQFTAEKWQHKRVELMMLDEIKGYGELTVNIGRLVPKKMKGKEEQLKITWPIKIDRPLPPGAKVKQVAVQRVRSGHRFRWEAIVTFCAVLATRDEEATGVVGVDVGWRFEASGEDRIRPWFKGSEGMRVATHDGSDGGREALRTDTLRFFLYTDAVRGVRDGIFDEAKSYVQGAGLPGAEHAHLWRDKERIRRLRSRANDLGVSMWFERDRHLEDIECGMRARAVRRRLYVFRVYADRLAKRYRYLALEDMPMSTWVQESETHAKERRRSIAALSLLQNVLVERFGPGRIHWEVSKDTSRTCSDCGFVRSESVGPSAEWCCASCGVVHHQDENAAQVIRQRCERWLAEGNPPRARGRKSTKEKGKRRADAVATGDEAFMVVTPRDPAAQAAE